MISTFGILALMFGMVLTLIATTFLLYTFFSWLFDKLWELI